MLKQNPKLSAGIKSYKILLGRFPEFQTFSNLDRVSFGNLSEFFSEAVILWNRYSKIYQKL